jgi:hypothetical protein
MSCHDGRAGGRDAGVVSGAVLFNDEPRSQAFFFRESAYVKQEDIHIPTLTVRETLRFAARLRLTAPQVCKQADQISQAGVMIMTDDPGEGAQWGDSWLDDGPYRRAG